METQTHIETLADSCPKSRRRCRFLLGWPKMLPDNPAFQVEARHVERAQSIATARERANVRKPEATQ